LNYNFIFVRQLEATVDNQNAAQRDSQNPDDSLPPTDITEANDPNTAEPPSAQQLTDVEKQMTGFEKSTLRWAKVAVLMSFLAAIFVCAQWYEMHSCAGDTHELAVAAKTQSDITKRVTEANFEAICDMHTETNLPEMQQTTDIVNTGGVNALTVIAHLEVTRNSLPDLNPLAPIETIELKEPEILKNQRTAGRAHYAIAPHQRPEKANPERSGDYCRQGNSRLRQWVRNDQAQAGMLCLRH
jgi:cell division protein FtsL